MSSTYEYIISLTDKTSGKLQKITGCSLEAVDKFIKLDDKTKALSRTTKDFGGSIFNLKQKIDLLQQERDLINPTNLQSIRKYNSEIKQLTKEVTKLETINGSRFKKFTKDAFSELPAIVRNPVALGAAAIGFTAKSAMNFDENMAKVNITAQLDEKGLADLTEKIKGVAKANKAEIAVAPVGFEKIISQTEDVDLSLQILDASMKGAKGGFVDLDTVSGALAQSLSIIGKENANAKEVLDTFFAAKRVGAGEFADFAKYLPGLIAGASNLGIEYKSVAGVFAYMTGKGQSAERAAVLMENAFSVLGKADIRGKMEKAGINVFDDAGKMRGVVDIFKDMQGVMGAMNNEQKSVFLEKLGIVDKEAKNAFAILTSDTDKLTESLTATAQATGETEKALQFSQNAMQKATELWVDFKNIAFKFGEIVLPIVNIGLDVLGGILFVLEPVISGIATIFSWFFNSLVTGNPWVWGLTAAVAALTIAYNIHTGALSAATIATKSKAIWDGIAAGAIKIWTFAQWALNTSLYGCPIVWIIAGIGALIGIIVACCTKVQGWGKQWQVIVDFMKNVWALFIESFKFRWNLLINGFMFGLDKIRLGWYKFKESCGLGNSDENQAMIAEINTDVENRKQTILEGAKKIQELTEKTKKSLSWELSWKKEEEKEEVQPQEATPEMPKGLTPQPQSADFDSLMKKIGGDKKETKSGSKSDKVLDLNKTAENLKGSTDYGAIAARLAPVKMESGKTLVQENNTNTITEKVLRPAVNLPPVPVDFGGLPKTSQTIVRENNTQPIAEPKEIRPAVNLPPPEAKVKMFSPMQWAKAAAIALPLSVATATTLPAEPSVTPDTPQTELAEHKSSGTFKLDKFCDKIEIHIASADDRGIDEITRKIEEKMDEMLSQYEA